MPVWLASAMRMLLPVAGGAALATIGGGGIPFLPPVLDPFEPGGFDIFAKKAPKRRRRRRALTASDRADIAFIVGLIGVKAGDRFAVQLATRPR